MGKGRFTYKLVRKSSSESVGVRRKVVAMETQHTQGMTFEKFTWVIRNFSKLGPKKLYSETFFLGGHPWRIILHPKGNFLEPNCLSIFLEAGDLANLPENWSRFTKYKLALVNQLLATKTIRKGMKSYTERFEKVKRIKKNVDELDKEAKELKGKDGYCYGRS
ncbi:TRAF-like [Sesbania bispinosa]|nr:TRAF-like [Sesbania bispinosa]